MTVMRHGMRRMGPIFPHAPDHASRPRIAPSHAMVYSQARGSVIEHLAVAVLGQGRHPAVLPGRLKRAICSGTGRPGLIIGRRLAIGTARRSPPRPIRRPACHRRLAHARVQEQHLLHLARVDVGAARDDHVLLRPSGVKPSIRLPTSPVCSQPPRSVCIIRPRVVSVAGHDRVAAHQHLAQLALGLGSSLASARAPPQACAAHRRPLLINAVRVVHQMLARQGGRWSWGIRPGRIRSCELLAMVSQRAAQVVHIHPGRRRETMVFEATAVAARGAQVIDQPVHPWWARQTATSRPTSATSCASSAGSKPPDSRHGAPSSMWAWLYRPAPCDMGAA